MALPRAQPQLKPGAVVVFYRTDRPGDCRSRRRGRSAAAGDGLPGTVFSGAIGETLEDAAAFVPHGTIRFTTVGAILAAGGSVTLKPEMTRSGKINERHVDLIEGSAPSAFSDALPNPVPKQQRIR